MQWTKLKEIGHLVNGILLGIGGLAILSLAVFWNDELMLPWREHRIWTAAIGLGFIVYAIYAALHYMRKV